MWDRKIRYCERCLAKELRYTSHFCIFCLYKLTKVKKTIDEKKKFDKEFEKITSVSGNIHFLAWDYLSMLEQSPILLSEMPMKREKARKVMERMRCMKEGFFIRGFKFKPKHYHETEMVLWYRGQEEKVRNRIRFLYGKNIRFPDYLKNAVQK